MKKYFLIILSLMISISGVFMSACSPTEGNIFKKNNPEENSRQIYAMDTYMDLKVYGENGAEALDEASRVIYSLDNSLSATNSSSDIYRLNSRSTDTVSGDVLNIIEESIRMSRITEGYFDITVYPLVRAWGFTTSDYHVPDDSQIQELLTHTGIDMISLSGDGNSGTITFADDEVELDMGAIAKGYASDMVYGIFKKYNISSAIAALGGNVCAFGARPDGSDWLVAIQDPFDQSSYSGTIAVQDRFLVTSGGYQRFFEQDGKTYHHIINPFTGMPAESGLASVTIVSQNGTQADALSTALYIMGLDKSIDFWRACEFKDSLESFDAIFITDDGDIYVTENIADRFTCEGGFHTVEK